VPVTLLQKLLSSLPQFLFLLILPYKKPLN
jgi:hypothetical protein